MPFKSKYRSSGMEDLMCHIDKNKLPRHIAVVMDGNGRWAKSKGKARVFGHKNGVTAVREITEGSAELGIEYLTLFTFSSENWNRPAFEVNALMQLLVETIHKEVKTLNKNNIKLEVIGEVDQLPAKTAAALLKGVEDTQFNNRMVLTLAINYGGRQEILKACKKIAEQVALGSLNIEEINHNTFSQFLYTKSMPDPELLIRTSGEMRISNFLLWQLAYSELYFAEVLWPDFRKKHLIEAIINYQSRERRFGKTSEQLQENGAHNNLELAPALLIS